MPTADAGQAGATGSIILWLALAAIVGAVVIAVVSSPGFRGKLSNVLAGHHPADEAPQGAAADGEAVSSTVKDTAKAAAIPYRGFDPDLIYGTGDEPSP